MIEVSQSETRHNPNENEQDAGITDQLVPSCTPTSLSELHRSSARKGLFVARRVCSNETGSSYSARASTYRTASAKSREAWDRSVVGTVAAESRLWVAGRSAVGMSAEDKLAVDMWAAGKWAEYRSAVGRWAAGMVVGTRVAGRAENRLGRRGYGIGRRCQGCCAGYCRPAFAIHSHCCGLC